MSRLDENGHEVPDPTPLAIPVGAKKPESLEERIRRLVRSERFGNAMSEQGFETFEESEDFDIEDDPVTNTPYEEFFDPSLGRNVTPEEVIRNQHEYAKRTNSRTPPKAAPAAPEEGGGESPPSGSPPPSPPSGG